MVVNEHVKLSNFTLKTQIKVKEQCFYCCSILPSHSRVFNNKHRSYHKNECETAVSSLLLS